MRATAMAAMAKVGVELDPEAKVSDLNIAGRQLVAICRALAADAKLLIMDEPTASLTRHEVDALIKLVSESETHRHMHRICEPPTGRGA